MTEIVTTYTINTVNAINTTSLQNSIPGPSNPLQNKDINNPNFPENSDTVISKVLYMPTKKISFTFVIVV